MTNPELYNVRVLSERHGLSIQRVDAILRLKGLEDSWKKVRIPSIILASHCRGVGMSIKSISLEDNVMVTKAYMHI